MRLIDADALRKEHCEGCSADIQQDCKNDPVCASLMWVVEAPAIDAVPVVRCEDCKFFDIPERDCLWCYQLDREVRRGGFCFYGERRSEC